MIALPPPMFANMEPSEEEFEWTCRRCSDSIDAKHTYMFVLNEQPFVKIGRSNDPYRRCREIELRVGPIGKVGLMRGGMFEGMYHQAFAEHRIARRSEYFHAHPDILGEVDRLIAWMEKGAA